MNNKNNKNKSILNQGYSKYSKPTSNLENKSKLEIDADQKNFSNKVKSLKYPKGIMNFIFIFLFSLGAFLLALLYGQKKLIDCFTIASGIGFFLTMAWLIYRQSFGLKTKYSVRKFFDYITFKEKRREKNMVNLSLAINNVHNFNEYEQFVELKKRNSTIMFYVCIGFYTLFFLICIILTFALY